MVEPHRKYTKAKDVLVENAVCIEIPFCAFAIPRGERHALESSLEAATVRRYTCRHDVSSDDTL
jgi:hypothetical protein